MKKRLTSIINERVVVQDNLDPIKIELILRKLYSETFTTIHVNSTDEDGMFYEVYLNTTHNNDYYLMIYVNNDNIMNLKGGHVSYLNNLACMAENLKSEVLALA